jgi:hypothetical protein
MPRHSVRVRLSDEAYEVWRRLSRHEKVRVVWILEYILDHKARTGLEPVILSQQEYRLIEEALRICRERVGAVGG